MTPAVLIREGKLAEAREVLVTKIKSAPGDTKSRTLLFQVLAFYGEWDKVERHLELLISQLPETATGVLVYRNLVAAERARREVAAGRQLPEFMTDPPTYLSGLLEARKALIDGDSARFGKIIGKVRKEVPEISGFADSKPFAGFSECDATLTGMIEVFVHDRYLWLPLPSVRELSVPQPQTLLETLWIPGRVVTWDGLTTDCFLPVLYPETYVTENDQLRMGRLTDWIALGKDNYRGVGQHLFAIGEQEMGLLELGEVTFNRPKVEVSQC
jgi:type VI secretion system protein ImpE